jgi:hypothetical protein
MHHVIAWPIVVVGAILLASCADLVGPNPRSSGDPTSIAEPARRRPKPPAAPPDTVRIPPPPVPPIYEELPLILDAPQ